MMFVLALQMILLLIILFLIDSALDTIHPQVITAGGVIIAGIVGAAIGFGGTFISTRQSNQFQRQQEHIRDLQRLRDARYDRARRASSAILGWAYALQDTEFSQRSQARDSGEHGQSQQVYEPYENAASRANQALVELSLESDTTELVRAFYDVKNTFSKLQNARASNRQDPRTYSFSYIFRLQDSLRMQVMELESKLRDHLSQLERPIMDDQHTQNDSSEVQNQ